MPKLKRLLSIALMLGLTAAIAPAAQDFIICANVNKGYVIGSTITTTNGLFRLNDKGEWQHFGYNDTSITAVAFDPRDHNVIYTAALNGLWVSYDGGEGWRMVNSWDMTEGQDVAIDPNSPDTVYLALPDGVGVSLDQGKTIIRREKGLPDRGKFTKTIEVDRTTAGRVLAGCEKGIFLTEDAGLHWRQVLPTTTQVNDLEQSPHDASVWMASTDWHGAWMSHDGGVTWSQIKGLDSEHPIYNVTFDATNPQRLAVGGWANGILTSEDGGMTWVSRDAGLPENPRVWRVGVNPNNGRLYVSVFKETLYWSDDFGRTWNADTMEGSLVNYFVSLPQSED